MNLENKYLSEGSGRYISSLNTYSKTSRDHIDKLVSMIERGEESSNIVKLLSQTLELIYDDGNLAGLKRK